MAHVEPRLDFPAAGNVVSAVFANDESTCVDALGDAADAAILAELIAHKGAEGPLTLGLFGQAGSGKSTFLNLLMDRIAAVAQAAQSAENGPFLARIVPVRVEVTPGADPASELARAVYQAFGQSSTDYSVLIEEAQHAGRDAQAVARGAHQNLGAARVKLDAERQVLHELNGRSARLSETVLFETAGSKVDAYARRMRGAIESRLRGFGFVSGDPVLSFKTLVRDVAESDGMFPRLSGFFRSLWAFKGQSRLLVWALISVVLGMLAGFAVQTQASWSASLKAGPESLQPLFNALIAHADWLKTVQAGLFGLALVLVGWNIWRAIRFFMPISHGVALLWSDIAARKRDLDGLIAHQTQRVSVVAEEVDQAAKAADEASVRARSQSPARSGALPSFAMTDVRPPVAFLRALNDIMSGKLALAPRAGDKTMPSKPQRIVLGLDGLDRLGAQEAGALLRNAREWFSGPAYAIVVAAGGGEGLAHDEWAKLVQIPYQLSAREPARENTRLIAALLSANAPMAETIAVDPQVSAFDRPLDNGEIELLHGLAQLVGHQPRTVKRFVNLYRLARALEADNGPALALALAVQNGGTIEEIGQLDSALAQIDLTDLPEFGGRMGFFVQAVRRATDGSLSVAQLRRARAVARRFSFT